jgi:hypothetical protein
MNPMDASDAGSASTKKWKRESAETQPQSGDLANIRPIPSGAERAIFSGGSSGPFAETADASYEEEMQLGQEIAAAFKNNHVHPVFIFGSRGAGKTSLIASLLRYMRDRQEADASIELAEELFPSNDPRWERRIEWSRDVFYRKVFAFIDRQAPPATLEELPFFIPVKLVRKNGTGAYFAFLEGKGEWYQPDLTASVPFKKFKGFLQGVLSSFNDTATVIYVAPFVTDSADQGPTHRRMRESDIGLLGALEEYSTARKALFHQDKHLFLMTKWDVCCNSISSDDFLDPDAQEVQRILGERYQLAWKKYVSMPITNASAKSYSTYCAGIMDGANIAAPADDDAHMISTFPRKLWDTLYQNATGHILYQDVQPKSLGLLDRLLQILRG